MELYPLPPDAALLACLRRSPSTFEELRSELGVSACCIENSLRSLREAGFEIASHPTFGMQLASAPDRLVGDDILSRMRCPWIGEISVFESTASTNDLAIQRGLSDSKTPIVILAETQTAGRGRFARKWFSEPREGIWMSLLFEPDFTMEKWPRITSAAALAVARAIELNTGLRPQIKWPNDLQIHQRKICGLLVESAQRRGGGYFAVLGIGINANQTAFPEPLQAIATSLKMALGRHVDRTQLAATLLDQLAETLPRVTTDFPRILSGIRERSAVLGKHLRLHTGEGFVEGVAEDIDEEGRLLLRKADGSVECFSSGEVSSSPH